MTDIQDELQKDELAFLEELRHYECSWVAIYNTDDGEKIVGSGKNAFEAAHEAETHGFKDTVLFYVRRFDMGYIP